MDSWVTQKRGVKMCEITVSPQACGRSLYSVVRKLRVDAEFPLFLFFSGIVVGTVNVLIIE